MKTKAYAYLRVSGKGQAGSDKDGFPRQRAAVHTFARKAGISLVHEFRDDVSGTNDAKHRPGFGDMVAAMLSNGVKAVVVERLDRLARAYRIQEELSLYLAGHGIALYSADTEENITASMLDDPMKKAVIQMRGVFHELDKNMLVKKLSVARKRIRNGGRRCEGRKPYGSYPGEAHVVSRMRQLRRKPRGGKRLSVARIAAKLNDEGHKTRTGKAWAPQTVLGILNRKDVQ